MSNSTGDAQPWPLARQQLSKCLAEAGVQLACACFRAVVPEVGGTLANPLDFPASPAGFRCLGGGDGGGGGAGHAVAAATTVLPAVNGSWWVDCLRASDSGVTGRFHCACACGGGDGDGGSHHVTCAETCGGGGGCPKPTAEGRLCELFPAPPDSLLTAPLVSGIVGLALLCVVLLIGMRLVKCKVPLYRARFRDCWFAFRRHCCHYQRGFHQQQQQQHQMPADAAQMTSAGDVGQQLDEQLRPLGRQDRTGRGRDEEEEEESGA